MLLDLLGASLEVLLYGLPLMISVAAFLDAARWPSWVWALAGRRRVIWLCLIFLGILSVFGGLLISGYYLLRVRPVLRGVEDGRLDKT